MGDETNSHEWVSIEDPLEDRTWLFDATFLLSGWTCIFGAGCQGVLTGPAPELVQGCCSYGAHFADEDDLARVEAAAATLTASEWQFAARAKKGGIVRRSGGELKTRLVNGACIFLNRPGFDGAAGCALHNAALAKGREPLELKPDVCWQLPLRREDLSDTNGHVTSLVTEWDRRHWGEAGAEFHWWCTEAPEAFTATEPFYLRLRPELVALVGQEIYDLVKSELDARRSVFLAHPVVRHRKA